MFAQFIWKSRNSWELDFFCSQRWIAVKILFLIFPMNVDLINHCISQYRHYFYWWLTSFVSLFSYLLSLARISFNGNETLFKSEKEFAIMFDIFTFFLCFVGRNISKEPSRSPHFRHTVLKKLCKYSLSRHFIAIYDINGCYAGSLFHAVAPVKTVHCCFANVCVKVRNDFRLILRLTEICCS